MLWARRRVCTHSQRGLLPDHQSPIADAGPSSLAPPWRGAGARRRDLDGTRSGSRRAPPPCAAASGSGAQRSAPLLCSPAPGPPRRPIGRSPANQMPAARPSCTAEPRRPLTCDRPGSHLSRSGRALRDHPTPGPSPRDPTRCRASQGCGLTPYCAPGLGHTRPLLPHVEGKGSAKTQGRDAVESAPLLHAAGAALLLSFLKTPS